MIRPQKAASHKEPSHVSLMKKKSHPRSQRYRKQKCTPSKPRVEKNIQSLARIQVERKKRRRCPMPNTPSRMKEFPTRHFVNFLSSASVLFTTRVFRAKPIEEEERKKMDKGNQFSPVKIGRRISPANVSQELPATRANKRACVRASTTPSTRRRAASASISARRRQPACRRPS